MRIRLTILALILGMSTTALAQDCVEGERLFSHHEGDTCIPAQPERIAALRGDQTTTPLLDIGAPVVASQTSRMDDGSAYVRGASDIFGQAFVDAADLIDLGAGQLDFEAIAAANPDLIIGPVWVAEAYDQLSSIAPTIILPPNLPYLDHLSILADAAGMKDSYEDRLEQYRARIDTAREIIGDPSDIVLSRFDLWEDGLWFYPNWGAVDQVINDLGFSRPTIQAEADRNLSGFSAERIGEFDGDILLASRATRRGQPIEMLTEQWDDVAPFWRNLSGVESGNLYWYERDVWVGYSFESLDKVIDGLTLITAGRDL